MRNRLVVAAVLLLVSFLGPDLAAQTIRGRLLDGTTRAPVVGALAELRDSEGKMVSQTFTSPAGAFAFVGSANQRYQVRIAAIGYSKHPLIDVALGHEPVVLPDIILTPMVVTLPDLHAMAGKRACGKSELNPETFGGLLESANTSLRVMDATLRSAQLAFEMQVINTHTIRTSKDSSVSADTSSGTLHEWPVQSLSIDSLKLLGYQRPKTSEEGWGHQWYGPDMQVLVSDWFLENHCFTLDKDRSKGDTVVIKFDPTGHQKHVDVSGTLVLDRTSLTMRRLTFELRDLPDGLPDRAAGGEIRFDEKSDGLWVPVEWAVWAPITKSVRSISRPMLGVPPPGAGRSGGRGGVVSGNSFSPQPLVQVVGRVERRGRLTRIVPMGG